MPMASDFRLATKYLQKYNKIRKKSKTVLLKWLSWKEFQILGKGF